MKNKPFQIALRKKEALQLESDIFLFAEGKGMCQDGAVELTQKGCDGERCKVRFHRSDIPQLIAALNGDIPEWTEDNDELFRKNVQKVVGDGN